MAQPRFDPQAALQFIRDRLSQRGLGEAENPSADGAGPAPLRQPPGTARGPMSDLSFLSRPARAAAEAAGEGAAPRPGCRQRLAEALGTGEQAAQSEPRDSPRMEAVGSVDELNSVIGVALAHGLCPRLAAELPVVQRELIQLASNLAFAEEEGRTYNVRPVEPGQVARLEALTDELGREVGTLNNFILPGGTPGAAQLHVARAVSMRAGRAAVTLSRGQKLGDHVIPYLCQLTHALFAMARYENRYRNVAETVVGGTADPPPGRCC